MNHSDTDTVVEFVASIVGQHPNAASIAFDSSELTGRLRNVRRSVMLDEINDALSHTSVCHQLCGIYSVCEYEGRVWFLVKADLAVSVTPLFDPKSKAFPQDTTSDWDEGEEETVGTTK